MDDGHPLFETIQNIIENADPAACVDLLNHFRYEGKIWEILEEPNIRDYASGPGDLSGRLDWEGAHANWEEENEKHEADLREQAGCLIYDLFFDDEVLQWLRKQLSKN